MDAIDTIAIVFTLIRYFILIPAMIYSLLLFHKYRNDDLIKHRSPLMYIVTTITIITVGGERTFMLSVASWNILNINIWVVYFMFSIFWWALFGLFAIKVYHLYYKQQFNIA
eukprot:165144_1